MEELFWRDYLWRFTIAPNNFKLAAVGEWDRTAFLAVGGAFALVHGHWWLTSIGWAMMVGALLAYTRSLGACIISHASPTSSSPPTSSGPTTGASGDLSPPPVLRGRARVGLFRSSFVIACLSFVIAFPSTLRATQHRRPTD
jgi:hypothetical protein